MVKVNTFPSNKSHLFQFLFLLFIVTINFSNIFTRSDPKPYLRPISAKLTGLKSGISPRMDRISFFVHFIC